jgi:hypothetical protein
MIATYRLRDHIPSFEFFSWLVVAKAQGATEIVFDVTSPRIAKAHTYFGLNNIMERFRSIIEPGPALAGLPSRIGNDPSQMRVSAFDLFHLKFPRLLTVDPPIECDYTVTIRENSMGGARGRDSHRDAWEKFASEIGAHVIDDYARNPIHLHTRMAMYAGARMNFGVCNGPVHMISLTPYPVAMWVNGPSAANSQLRWGMRHGQKYPWMLPNQSMIWQSDTVDNLRRSFDGMQL